MLLLFWKGLNKLANLLFFSYDSTDCFSSVKLLYSTFSMLASFSTPDRLRDFVVFTSSVFWIVSGSFYCGFFSQTFCLSYSQITKSDFLLKGLPESNGSFDLPTGIGIGMLIFFTCFWLLFYWGLATCFYFYSEPMTYLLFISK